MTLSDGQQISVIIHNICSAFLPFFLVIIGFRELRRWRTELIGKNKIELAQKIGRLAVRLNNQFQFCVSPVTFSTESEKRERQANETSAEASMQDERFARWNRLKVCLDTFSELIEVLNEAEIVFGKEMKQYIEQYNQALTSVNVALHIYHDRDRSRNLVIHDQSIPYQGEEQYIKDAHAVIYGINTKASETVSKTTSELVAFAKQVMR
ncbi:MAG: hypothetical protein SF123_14290 [Chloroflexota bacterium]|nr:hypothetical protein [Chloroflexota bacterium]